MAKETRDIPAALDKILTSPAQPLADFSLETKNKLALTNLWFEGKWTFVYFSYGHCLLACGPTLTVLTDLKASFASDNNQFLVIGIDTEHETSQQLSTFLNQQGLDITAATGNEEDIDRLAKQFVALFLRTDFSDGSYQIEQEHTLFLVDPKGRIYASFPSSMSSSKIKAEFFKLRAFYAKSE